MVVCSIFQENYFKKRCFIYAQLFWKLFLLSLFCKLFYFLTLLFYKVFLRFCKLFLLYFQSQVSEKKKNFSQWQSAKLFSCIFQSPEKDKQYCSSIDAVVLSFQFNKMLMKSMRPHQVPNYPFTRSLRHIASPPFCIFVFAFFDYQHCEDQRVFVCLFFFRIV